MKRFFDRLPDRVYRVADLLEIAVGVIVALAIVLSFPAVLHQLVPLVKDPSVGLTEFLFSAFNLAIGIEFLKMLCRHSVGSVVEVLLFVLARGMVLEHGTATENLLIIAGIALLFVVRKFLFIPGLDDKHHRGKEAKKTLAATASGVEE